MERIPVRVGAHSVTAFSEGAGLRAQAEEACAKAWTDFEAAVYAAENDAETSSMRPCKTSGPPSETFEG